MSEEDVIAGALQLAEMTENPKLFTIISFADQDIPADFNGGVLRRNVEILREGHFNHPWYGPMDFDQSYFEHMIKNFNDNVLQRDIAIHVEHGMNSEAAGWYVKGGMSCKKRKFADGKNRVVLNSEIDWTPLGLEKISSKQYKYFSIEFTTNLLGKEVPGREPGKDVVKEFGPAIVGGALVNNPFIPGMMPVALSESGGNKVYVFFSETEGEGKTNDEEGEELLKVKLSDGTEIGIEEGLTGVSKPGIYEFSLNGEDFVVEFKDEDFLQFANWTRAYINTLPDSSFAVIEPAYKDGKTTNKNARHLPFKDKDGKVDLPHLRNALARCNQIIPVTNSISAEELRRRASVTLAKYTSHLKSEKKKASEQPEGGIEMKELIEKLMAELSEIKKSFDTLTEDQKKNVGPRMESMEKQIKALADVPAPGKDPEMEKQLAEANQALVLLAEKTKKLEEEAAKSREKALAESLKTFRVTLKEKRIWPATIEIVASLCESEAKAFGDSRVIEFSEKDKDGKDIVAKISFREAISRILDSIPEKSRMDLSESTKTPEAKTEEEQKQVLSDELIQRAVFRATGKKANSAK